jgi:hypothetical protein
LKEVVAISFPIYATASSYKYLPKILKNQAILLAYDFFEYWQYHATGIAYQNNKLYKPKNDDELGILRLQVVVK